MEREKESPQQELARTYREWEEAREAAHKVGQQFIAIASEGQVIPKAPRALDEALGKELQDAQEVEKEKEEAYQRAWRRARGGQV